MSILIESLAYHGSGVARLPDGRTVFVENAVPGDRVHIEIIENRKRYAHARVTELLTPSPHRIAPSCPHYATCDGCTLQHLAYSEQCVWKHRAVVDALRHIGGVNDAEKRVENLVPAAKIWGYRNKIELEAQILDRGVKLGFHTGDDGYFAPVDSCFLLPRAFREAPYRIAGALTYACREVVPDLLRVGIRVSELTGDVELALWTRPCNIARALTARVLNETLRTTSMTRVIVDGAIKERKVKQVEVLAGRGYWRETLDGRIMKISAPSFYQVNSSGADVLVSIVLEFLERAEVSANSHIADLYAGAGTFTVPLAARYAKVSAIESYGSSIRDLRRNLEENEVTARLFGGDVARELSGIGSFAAAIVDPPRTGLAPLARTALISARPRCIIYVSCNPATLARDVKHFVDNNYRLITVRPVDLFPQTYHIESVALFVYREKDPRALKLEALEAKMKNYQ